jgi:hypothetical protein
VCTATFLALTAATVGAQKPQKPDSTGFVATATRHRKGPAEPETRIEAVHLAADLGRRAFLYSGLIPGMGQAALDRKNTGAVFFLIEAMSWAMLRRSVDDERIAKRFLGDSVPRAYVTDPSTGLVQRDARGNPIVSTWTQSQYTEQLVRARALHVEDWVAVILFNHLFA